MIDSSIIRACTIVYTVSDLKEPPLFILLLLLFFYLFIALTPAVHTIPLLGSKMTDGVHGDVTFVVRFHQPMSEVELHFLAELHVFICVCCCVNVYSTYI